MNDPGLITLVNKLQDVFTTVGVSTPGTAGLYDMSLTSPLNNIGPEPNRSTSDRGRRITVKREEFSIGEYSGKRFVCRLAASRRRYGMAEVALIIQIAACLEALVS